VATKLNQNLKLHIFDIGKEGEREYISGIAKNSKHKPIVVTNAGFFSMNFEKAEHSGALIVDGQELSPYQPRWDDSNSYTDLVKLANTFIQWKDGRTEIKKITVNDLEHIKQNAEWAIGAGYTLVQDGNIMVTKNNEVTGNDWYDRHNKRSRTMFGINKDGNYISVVVDGGYSSAFWYDGSVRNNPSRRIGSVMIITSKQWFNTAK